MQTGKVRLVSRPFSFLGENSFKAAEAAECAADQGKYWEYREAIYKNQAALQSATADTFKAWAGEVGADQTQFSACYDSGKYTSLVKQEAQTAQSLGVPGTPTLTVDGQIVKGATGGIPTDDELAAAIDQAAAKKGK